MTKNTTAFLKNLCERIDWKCVGAVLVAFGVTRAMVLVVTFFAMKQIPLPTNEQFWRYDPSQILVDGLARWDSGWYIPIAQKGYSVEYTAFFPLYPFLIRLISMMSGDIWKSGLWISNVAFLMALFYIYAIAKQEFDDDTAGRAVFYLAAAPAAFFFSTLYSEGLFVLFVAACFYYGRNGKWLLAGLAGALASATRLTGVLVAVFLLFEALWQQGIRFLPRPWKWPAFCDLLKRDLKLLPSAWKGLLASLFSTSGLVAYLIFLGLKFGNPLVFLQVEKGWDKEVSWNWAVRLVQNILDLHLPVRNSLSGGIANLPYLMDTIFILVFIPLVIAVLIKFRPSYGWYTFLSFLLPLVSGNPISMRRYVLALIPCYFLLALWGKRPWVDRMILGISLPLQSFFLVLFSHWYFAG